MLMIKKNMLMKK